MALSPRLGSVNPQARGSSSYLWMLTPKYTECWVVFVPVTQESLGKHGLLCRVVKLESSKKNGLKENMFKVKINKYQATA
jgi:hypothetical protein